ncbi:MAG TPA: NAD(P)/FAD-dependent oxidoreductase [Vicinamibacterales bacterium]|nr:NAD(P)/FAD-dependent oxidoreductase [Vicinamibacterales bacterium]
MDYDVIIVGAGPAGLSAALILGRCRRKVLVLDTDRPRNAASHAVHGFLSRDGIHPQELRRLGRQQLRRYDSVKLARKEATQACAVRGGFEVTVADGKRLRCRKVLLATGVVDELPPLEGLAELYGRSVFHCPYCDGWESRDQPMAVYSRTANGVGLAIELTAWSKDIVLCTDGARIDPKHGERLERHTIPWRRDPIARLEGSRGRLRRIVFANGESLARRVMFFSVGQRQASHLAGQLGCGFTQRGAVRTGEYEVTDIPGVYVAGDASKLVQLAIVAAAEGAQAAFAINTALIKEDLAR